MTRKLRVGDWVEVRSKHEILKTLDGKGQLDGMPFMPEMFAFCGERFQVQKRAHKSCDPDFYSRRIERSVHLGTRCNGSAHGGCQAGCTTFWKEDWLKPVGRGTDTRAQAATGHDESNVWNGVQIPDANGGPPTWVCQTTQVPHVGEVVRWWDIRQYFEDYTSGNETLGQLFSGILYATYYSVTNSGIGVGRAMRWFYGKTYPLWRGVPWPRKTGVIPEGQPTPTASLNLQAGELVRIKSQEEILTTINTSSKNRGLWWDAELVPYCEGTYKVLRRVTKIIDEKTGKMQEMKNPCIILDSVVCRARYSANRMFCPRNTYAYFREIWLERVEPQAIGGEPQSLAAVQCGSADQTRGCRPGA